MRKTITLTFTFILIFVSIQTQAQTDVYDALLKTYVDSQGNVDYKGLRKNRAVLDIYIKHLDNTIPSNKWSQNKAKAFWINAYNAYTIKLILDSYPLKKKLPTLNVKEEMLGRFLLLLLVKKLYSLDYIEHKILRRWHDDPRIHVALNAASKSGPRFVNFAFTKENIEEALENLMKAFINDSTKNKITLTKVEVSKNISMVPRRLLPLVILLVDYINKYSHIKANDNAEVLYLDYDWSLNNK